MAGLGLLTFDGSWSRYLPLLGRSTAYRSKALAHARLTYSWESVTDAYERLCCQLAGQDRNSSHKLG